MWPVDGIPPYAVLAAERSLTASEVHGAVSRVVAAQLALKDEAGRPRVRLEPLRLFVQHGARYCFPTTRGPQTRGVPTGYAAPPLSELIRAPAVELPSVWPDKDGTVRGETRDPLYPTVPQAARRNPALYELLALFDAIRAGSPASASWPCSSWINDGGLPIQHLPEPPGDLGSDLCVPSNRYSPDSQARTCCLSPSNMASVILWGNPAGCPVVICA